MKAIIAAIIYNFRNLARFSGRNTRAQFWPYAIFLFIAQTIISLTMMLPFIYSVMTKTFLFVLQHPGKPGVPVNPADQKAFGQVMQGIMADTQSMLMTATPILTAVFVILIGAAVARRLHDRGMSGYWGLMPLPFTIIGLAAMPKTFEAWPYHPNLGLFGLLMLNSMLHLTLAILLIVLLAQRGAAGANRFGPEVTDWQYSP
ncbi:MAG TPA: DUF805 domain-containing protein [Stellaceae bacterium]|nr:DUF805 domain-containing protein [Stellaceae bacterium]